MSGIEFSGPKCPDNTFGEKRPINIINNDPYSVYMLYYDQLQSILFDLVHFSSEFGRKLVHLCLSIWNVRIFQPKCPGSSEVSPNWVKSNRRRKREKKSVFTMASYALQAPPRVVHRSRLGQLYNSKFEEQIYNVPLLFYIASRSD